MKRTRMSRTVDAIPGQCLLYFGCFILLLFHIWHSWAMVAIGCYTLPLDISMITRITRYLDQGSISTSQTSTSSHAAPAPGRRTKWKKEPETKFNRIEWIPHSSTSCWAEATSSLRFQKNQRQIQETSIDKTFPFPKEKKESNLLLNGGDVVVDLPQGLLDLAVLPLKLDSHLTDLRLHLITQMFVGNV